MKRFFFFAAIVLLASAASATAQDPRKDDEASPWMKRKLELSQRVFAGLAAGDYDAIGESARTMENLNRIELFIRGRNDDYRTQLRAFQFANRELIRAADAKNLDRATLAFQQMTLSCVNCHKQLRDGK
jgi:hypothetical protein